MKNENAVLADGASPTPIERTSRLAHSLSADLAQAQLRVRWIETELETALLTVEHDAAELIAPDEDFDDFSARSAEFACENATRWAAEVSRLCENVLLALLRARPGRARAAA